MFTSLSTWLISYNLLSKNKTKQKPTYCGFVFPDAGFPISSAAHSYLPGKARDGPEVLYQVAPFTVAFCVVCILIEHLSSYGCQNVLIIPCGLARSAQRPLLGFLAPCATESLKGACSCQQAHEHHCLCHCLKTDLCLLQIDTVSPQEEEGAAVRLHRAGSPPEHLRTDSSTIIQDHSYFKFLSLPRPEVPSVTICDPCGENFLPISGFHFLGHVSASLSASASSPTPVHVHSCLIVEICILQPRLLQRFQKEQLPPSPQTSPILSPLMAHLLPLWSTWSVLFWFSSSFQLKGNILTLTYTIVVKILLAQKHGPRAMRY